MFSVNDILLNEFQNKYKMKELNLLNFSVKDVHDLIKTQVKSKEIENAIVNEKIDGKTLLLLNERDLYTLQSKYFILLGDLKKLLLMCHKLQSENRNCLLYLGLIDSQTHLINNLLNTNPPHHAANNTNYQHHHHHNYSRLQEVQDISPANSENGSFGKSGVFATCIQPEFFKTIVSLGKCSSNNVWSIACLITVSRKIHWFTSHLKIMSINSNWKVV